MSFKKIRCRGCGRWFSRDPRVKSQRYCGCCRCQRKRKRLWQKQRMAADPDYRDNHRESQRKWREAHPDYYRRYRERNSDKVERNRRLQRGRNGRRCGLIAKKDAMGTQRSEIKGETGRVLSCPMIAKMDAIEAQLVEMKEKSGRVAGHRP